MQDGNTAQREWRVTGMDCGSCAAKVRGAVERLPGVEDSPGKFRASMDNDWVFPAPFAALLPIDPDAPAGPQVDLSELADGGLVFLVPTGQLAAPFAADRIERAVDGLPSPAERVAHLFGHRLGVDLPDVLTIALDDPAVSLMDVLTGEGLGDLDLAAVAVLAVPLWAIPAD